MKKEDEKEIERDSPPHDLQFFAIKTIFISTLHFFLILRMYT